MEILINKLLQLIEKEPMRLEDIQRFFYKEYKICYSTVMGCLKKLLNEGKVEKIIKDGIIVFKQKKMS